MAQRIHSILIIEVAGRPPEYLKNSLEIHIDKMRNLKGIEFLEVKYFDPKKLENEKDLYTMFAEVQIKTSTLGRLMEIIFEFMPSSVEIIDPAELQFNCQEATVLMNDLAGRLHKYDDLAKIAKFHIKNLSDELAKHKNQSNQQTSIYQPVKVSSDYSSEKKKEKKSEKQVKKKKSKK